ncbi:uncharacterized protein LOC110722206 [Chenopodium quinoa]|uniref:uncharacterized protein LOC110722206 n=1 Tax=Chenopodium quinoa TaxID=63459 RepID=UPI000B76E265|nr:uncharacterized protein LOC110722206 [Chenopodium quinoa]
MEDRQLSQESGTVPSFYPSQQHPTNPQPNSQTGERPGSYLQLLNNLQLNSKSGEHPGSYLQPLSNLQLNSQSGEHLGPDVQPRRNLQAISQTDEYLDSHLQHPSNLLFNSRTGERLGPNMQPQTNLLPNNQSEEHLRSVFQLFPRYIQPNQPETSTQKQQRLQQSDHMIPGIGSQLGSANLHSAVQWNPLASSYELQQSAPQPVTNFPPTSFWSSQGGYVDPSIWNNQLYYDLIRKQAEIHDQSGSLNQSNNPLQSELLMSCVIGISSLAAGLNDLKQSQRQIDGCKSHIRRLDAELDKLKKQSQGHLDHYASHISRLKEELINLKQSQEQMANDIRHISAGKASEKNTSGKSIPSDDTLPSTGKLNFHLGGGSASSNNFLARAFQDGVKISDSYKQDERNPLVQSGSDLCSSSGVKIKAGEQSKGPVNMAAREGLSATNIHRDEFIQGEKKNDGNTRGFPSK